MASAAQSTALTSMQFADLTAIPPEAEWFANLDSAQTRRAYKSDIHEFMRFAGIEQPEQFREIVRAHVLAWRKTLEDKGLAASTLRRKLAALSSLYDYLCDRNCVPYNPVKGVKRPKVESQEGKTPALGDHQARQLLDAPDPATGSFKCSTTWLATTSATESLSACNTVSDMSRKDARAGILGGGCRSKPIIRKPRCSHSAASLQP